METLVDYRRRSAFYDIHRDIRASPKTQPRSTRILTNRDVLSMFHKGMRSDLIIATILTTSCNFDIFPPGSRRSEATRRAGERFASDVGGSERAAQPSRNG